MSRRSKAQPAVTVGAITDIGCVRSQNEDSMLVELPLLVVADGIGGQEAGEVASQIAIETMEEEAPRYANAEELGEAAISANKAVMDGVERGRGRPGMGTTLTAVVIENDKMAVAQVGDSRAYRLRGGVLEQLTNDHSLIAAMLESGQITPEEAKNHPSRSIITRALGSDPEMVPDLFEFDLAKGDRIILCSDGLSSMIGDVEIRDILNEHPDPQEAAEALVEASKKSGGLDNVTVIVANINQALPSPDKAERKTRKLSVILFSVIAALLVVCAVGGFAFYVRSSAFLIDDGGHVALYTGRLGNFAGLSLHWYEYTSDVETDKLPDLTVQHLKQGIQFESREDAEAAIVDYANQIGASTPTQSAGQQEAQPAEQPETQPADGQEAAENAEPTIEEQPEDAEPEAAEEG